MSNSILLLFFFSCLAIAPASCSSNQTDFLALLAIKSSIEVDQNGALNSWNDSTHFCLWEGILCSRKHKDRVVTINLSDRGLVGSLSPHIGNLSFLKNIGLEENNFHGHIPQEIGLLRSLEFVSFDSNNFSGEIPRNLSQCSNLTGLNLGYNNLVGMIPPHLGSLSKLKYLLLSMNPGLSGHIPPSIGNLTSLLILSLLYCGLKGEIPGSLAQIRRSEVIQIGSNNLTGTIPYGLFNISTIYEFDVTENHLQGSIPSSMGLTLPNLRNIYFGGNQFSGVVPDSLANASFLEDVDFSENKFTGPMPRLGTLSHLQNFLFNTNPIRDNLDFITSLTNCTNLQTIQVGENLLTGSLPHSIANFSNQLTLLAIFRSQINGNIPSGIGNLVRLTRLVLANNFLDGPIPSDLGKLHNMRELDLGANKFEHELPSSLGNLTFLIYLYLKRNNISGSVPHSLGNCINLLSIDLSSNNFSGLVPQEIMRISSISIFFNLSDNGFTGSIPSEVGSFTNLAILDLSNNKLSGIIPNSLSTCKSLLQLYLEGNSLEGKIPEGLGDLKGLQILDLSSNNLSGNIPSFLGTLQLEALNLSFNMLQGEVPTLGVFGNRSSIELDGNGKLCGGILELKLPPCSSKNPPNKNTSKLLKILLPTGVAGGICFILLVCYIVSIYKRTISRNHQSSLVPSFSGRQYLRLSYRDLLKATDGFSESNLVGAGRFGSVYKGILEDGISLVAVKVLNLVVKGAFKSFMAECNALRGIRHRNLLKIMSICQSTDFRGNEFKALVYEYMANGSLDNWLHRNGEQDEEIKTLDTIQRLDIAIDIAHGLEYLHFGTDQTIVHGDLKPSNILLDQDMTAHIGDFGLAKFMSSSSVTHESSSSSIGIKGTIGYVAPEYGLSDLFSTRGDTYSYGILLLELFTNIRPTDHDAFKGHENLHNFVKSVLPDSAMEIVHPCTRLEYNMNNSKIKECMASLLSIGVACSMEVPSDRMLMKDVVNELQKTRAEYLTGEWRR